MDIRHATFDITRARQWPFVPGLSSPNAEPVGKAQFDAVLDAAAPLQRRARDQSPPRRPSPVRRSSLDVPIEQDHAVSAMSASMAAAIPAIPAPAIATSVEWRSGA